jgi:hypothetical protein
LKKGKRQKSKGKNQGKRQKLKREWENGGEA